MKTRKQATQALHDSDATREREVQQEIDSFLRALSSYPDRFAREPDLSFRQHLSSIATASHRHNAHGTNNNHDHDHNEDRRRSG
jgi:hypothetical protein